MTRTLLYQILSCRRGRELSHALRLWVYATLRQRPDLIQNSANHVNYNIAINVKKTSKSSNYTISVFRHRFCHRNTIDQTTACTIATTLIHSKIDYCKLYSTQFTCYTNQSSSTCPELCCSCCHQTSKFHHITPILKSLHRLKINETNIGSLSHTYKSLKTGLPSYLRSLLSFPSLCPLPSLINLSHPFLTSRLKFANRS